MQIFGSAGLHRVHPAFPLSVKVAVSETTDIYAEIAAERKAAARQEFKSKLAAILDAKVQTDREFNKLQRELEKKKEDSYAQMSKSIKEALNSLIQTTEDTQAIQVISEAASQQSNSDSPEQASSEQ